MNFVFESMTSSRIMLSTTSTVASLVSVSEPTPIWLDASSDAWSISDSDSLSEWSSVESVASA